jgi:hypothetical protein
MIELDLYEKLNCADDNCHFVKFKYDGIVGHFSITDKLVCLCVLNDIAPEGLTDEIQRHIQRRGTPEDLDVDGILSRLLPNHLNNLVS